MKMTRAMLLGLAFLLPSVATVAKAEDKPAAAPAGEAAPADGEKKAKKGKKAKKADKEEKKEEAAPPAGEKK